MSAVELGCPGHFIAVESCRFRRHTQIGTKYRVSTVGDYFPPPVRGEQNRTRQTIGAGPNEFFETMVFATTGKPVKDNDGCGCVAVKDYSEFECRRWATAGEAQKGHEAMVRKYRRKVGQ